MTLRIFLSHASGDAAVAAALVAALEALDIPCWISSRDVQPGANYQEAIVAAIRSGRALVLLLTEAANASDEVKKEIALASAAGITVLPVKLGTITPNPALSYELATRQWIEGTTPADIAARLAAFLGAAPVPVAAPQALPLPDKPSLAVLPFQNMSGDAEQDYFADGMVEDITTALSRITGLFVIARNSAFTYKGRAIDMKQVGRELGVRYVLEGSVRKAGGRVRITCQLIEAATGTHLWADRFDGALDDVFELQDRVTQNVAAAIEPALRSTEIARAIARPTGNPDAYDLYLRALDQYDRMSIDGLDTALALLRQAIALDPGFGRAQALAAFVGARYVHRGLWRHDSPQAAECVAWARAALLTARDDATAQRYAGHTIAYVGRDLVAARVALDRALSLNPNSASVLMTSAMVHNYACEWQMARELFERAIRLSPRDPEAFLFLAGIGMAISELGDLEGGLLYHRQAAALGFPESGLLYNLVALGRVEEARALARDLVATLPESFNMEAAIDRIGAYLDPVMRARRNAALRVAGLPETMPRSGSSG